MKAINAQGAVPTMADNFIMYSGEIDNSSGALSDGTSLLVPITTEIRQLLIVKAQCFQSTDRTPSFSDRKFDANFKVEETSSGTKTITIEVPSGCLCNYQISGDKSIGTITHFEQAIGVGVADPQHAGGHRHDGNDSKKISYANITGTPTVPTYGYFPIFFQIDSPYSYGYFEPFTGNGGFTIPIAGHITKFSYAKDDGGGNTLKNTYSLGSPIAIAANDNLRLRFWDDSGTDKVTLYINGVVAGQFGASASYVDPGGSNRNFWTLLFRYSLT